MQIALIVARTVHALGIELGTSENHQNTAPTIAPGVGGTPQEGTADRSRYGIIPHEDLGLHLDRISIETSVLPVVEELRWSPPSRLR
jgi:hypothetical protein